MIMLHTSHSYSVSVNSHSLPSQARNRVISLFSSHSLPSKARNRVIILFSKIQSFESLDYVVISSHQYFILRKMFSAEVGGTNVNQARFFWGMG